MTVAEPAARPYPSAMSGATDLYDSDFYAWAQDQAARLRAWPEHLRPNGVDIENVAEEIESLGRWDRRAVGSLLYRIMKHLMKLALVRNEEPRRGWRRELDEFRAQAERLLAESPSLAAQLPEIAAGEWPRVRRALLRELEGEAGVPLQALPEALPFDPVAELLNPGWEPPPPLPH